MKPPRFSNIRFEKQTDCEVITIPYREKSEYFVVAPILLGGWLIIWGWTLYLAILFLSHDPFNQPIGFYICLLFWIIAGLFFILLIYKILRPSIPERIRLSHDRIEYDSGLPNLDLRTDKKSLGLICPNLLTLRRKRVLNKECVESIKLTTSNNRNILSVICDASELEIAVAAGDTERILIYNYLLEKYNLRSSS